MSEPEPLVQSGGGDRHRGITYEQKLKMQEWMDFAESGLAVHQQAQKRAEHMHFWLCALPTMSISAAVAILSLVGESSKEGRRLEAEDSSLNVSVIICGLSSFNSVLIGVSNFWKFAAEAEKNRFAAQEYDALHERLNLFKAQMELGKIEYEKVLNEIESAIHEVKKQCGPPPRTLVQEYKQQRAMADVKLAQLLQTQKRSMQDSSKKARGGGWRCSSMSWCCCRRRQVVPDAGQGLSEGNDAETVAMRLIDRKLQDIGRETSDSNMKSFGEDFWLRFRFAAERKDLHVATELLEMVPTSVSSSEFVHYDQNHRSPLHHVVIYQFWELLNFLLDGPAGECALWQDRQGRMPVEFITREDVHREPVRKLIVATFKSLCHQPHNYIGREGQKKIVLERIKAVAEAGKGSSLARLRDFEGFGLVHIASEYDHGDIIQELLHEPFHMCPYEGLSLQFDKRTEDMLQRWRDMGCIGGVSVPPPDTAITIAACSGSQAALKAMFSYIVRCSPMEDELAQQQQVSAKPKIGMSVLKKSESKGQLRAPTLERQEPAPTSALGDNENTPQLLLWDVKGAKETSGSLLLDSASKNVLRHVYKFVNLQASVHEMVSLEGVREASKFPVIGHFRQSTSFLYSSAPGDALETFLNYFKQLATDFSWDGSGNRYTNVSLLHYACAFGNIKLAKAILLTDPLFTRDGDGLMPYDYAVLRLRALCSEKMRTAVLLDSSLLNDTKGILSILSEHSAEEGFGHGRLELVLSQRTGMVWEDYKRFQANGLALHLACQFGLGQNQRAVKAILAARSKAKRESGRPLNLVQVFRDGKKATVGGGASSSGGRVSDDIMGLSPLHLAIKNEHKEVVRQLFAVASREGPSELLELVRDLNHFLEELDDGDSDDGSVDFDQDKLKGEQVRSIRHSMSRRHLEGNAVFYKEFFNIIFDSSELGEEVQEAVRVPEEIKAVSDFSYLVSIPCDFFTFGCERHGRSRGQYYYEVEFPEECLCFGGEDALLENYASFFIGWATDNFSKGSKDHVGRYPISWGFCPWNHWDVCTALNTKKNPEVWLNGQQRRVTSEHGHPCLALGGPRTGVGVCVDLSASRIAWRIFWPKGGVAPPGVAGLDACESLNGEYSYVWVYAPSREGVHAGKDEHKAWNNMGRQWAEKDGRVFPCLSASVNCRLEDVCILHVSGEFCVDPPPGYLPAVSEGTATTATGQGSAADDDGSSGEKVPVLPLASVHGNTPSQRDGTRESLSLLHLCALQGTPGVEVAEKLASEYHVPYMPLLDCTAEEFHPSMLNKPVWRDDAHTRPYQIALRSGASSARHIDKLKLVHEKHMHEARMRWQERLGWETDLEAGIALRDSAEGAAGEIDVVLAEAEAICVPPPPEPTCEPPEPR